MPHQSYQSFESRVQELKMYMEKHGHMKVKKKENESLYWWITKVRYNYSLIQKGREPEIKALTPGRIKMLRNIGFDFPLFTCAQQKYEETFESFVQELKMHIEEHGHMKVKRKESESLYNWIKGVRRSYRLMQENDSMARRPIKLTTDRMQILRDIGFDFCAYRTRQTPTFESRVQELKMYIQKHGHMKLTKEENESLHSWTARVRQSYRDMQKSRARLPINLTPDRMKLLHNIGFDFFATPTFESHVQDLKIYMEKHGHMKVRRKENTSLHLWINHVRRSYNIMQNGSMGQPPIKLTPDRMQMLQNIGFEFSTAKVGKNTQTQTESVDSYAKRRRDDTSSCSETGHDLGVATELSADSDTDSSFNCSMEDEDEHSSKRRKIDFNTEQSLLPAENENGRTNDNDCIENDSISIDQEEELPVVQNLQSSPATTTTVHNNALPISVSHDSCCAPSKCRYNGHEYNLDHDQSFESSVQELERYIEKHGHMKVSREENKALHVWIKNVRSSYRNIQEGNKQGPPSIELTPDRLEMLGHVGFEFETDISGWYKQLNFRQEDLF